jgi:hypothetical protein
MKDDDAFAPGDGVNPEGPEPGEQRASLGFGSRGLIGLFAGLRAMGESSEGVEDPGLLRAAEEAVAHAGRQQVASKPPIDEAWQTIATHDGPGGLEGLEDVARALDSEGIPVGWDPYEPAQEVGFMPPGMSARVYSLQVPASQAAKAKEVLCGVAPQGVTYGWAPEVRPPSALDRSAAADAEYGFDRSATGSRPRIGDPTISDNQRLERMVGGGPSGVAIALITVGGLLLIGIVVYALLMR